MRRLRPAGGLAGWGAAVALVALGGIASAQEVRCPSAAVACRTLPPAETRVAPWAPAFGVQVWPPSLVQSPAAVSDLIALAPMHLRFGIGPNWRRQPALRAAMTDAEMDDAVASGLASVPSTGAHIQLLAGLKSRLGAALHLVVWEPPPLPGEAAAPVNRHLDPGNATLAARFLVAVLKALNGQGLPLDGVELANEPDGPWNMRIEPRDYVALVAAVRAEAARRAVGLPRIEGPGTSTFAALRRFLADPDTADKLLKGVDVLSVHGWDDARKTDAFAELTGVLGRLAALGRRPEIVLSEYGVTRPVPADPSPQMNLKTREAQAVAASDSYAALTTRNLLRFYGQGIGTVIAWEFQDPAWGHASFGLLDPQGAKRPLYRDLQAVSVALRRGRPNAVRSTVMGARSRHPQPDRPRLARTAPETSIVTSSVPSLVGPTP